MNNELSVGSSPIPYNVYASNRSAWSDIQELLAQIKAAATEIGEDGEIKPVYGALGETGKTVFDLVWSALNGKPVDYGAVIKSVISLMGAIATVAFPPIGTVIGAATPLVNMLVGFLFPTSGTDQDNAVFQRIMEATKLLLNQKFEGYTLETNVGILAGLSNLMGEFREATGSAIGKRFYASARSASSPIRVPTYAAMDHVRETYERIYGHFNGSAMTNILAHPEYEVISLPQYTMAATLHLTLIQGFIQFSNTWYAKSLETDAGWNAANEDVYSQQVELAKVHLKQCIKTYSEKVNEIYKKHLKKYGSCSDTSIPTGSQIDQQCYVSDEPPKEMQTRYNRYVRTMKLQCLDYVAMWPTLDVTTYPVQTTLDQTRVLLSDVLGPTEDYNGSMYVNFIDMFNNNATNYRLSDIKYSNKELESIHFHSYNGFMSSQNASYNSRAYVNGVRLQYQGIPTQLTYIKGRDNAENDCNHNYDGHPNVGFCMSRLTDMNSTLNMSSKYKNSLLDLNSIWANNGSVLAGNYGGSYADISLSHNENLSTEKINALYPVTADGSHPANGNTDKIGFVAVHVPMELFPQNIIGHKGTDGTIGIKGIPAEKCDNIRDFELAGNRLSEHITGTSSVLKINQGQNCTFTFTNETAGAYQLRYRVATNSKTVNVSISGTGFQSPVGVTLPSTAELLSYNPDTNYKLVVEGEPGLLGTGVRTGYLTVGTPVNTPETPQPSLPASVTLPAGRCTLTITNISADPFILDRIEFVPPPPPSPTEDYGPLFYQGGIDGNERTIWNAPTGVYVNQLVGISTDSPINSRQMMDIVAYKDGQQVTFVEGWINEYFPDLIPEGSATFNELRVKFIHAASSTVIISGRLRRAVSRDSSRMYNEYNNYNNSNPSMPPGRMMNQNTNRWPSASNSMASERMINTREELEHVRELVNQLFTSRTYATLAPSVTNSWLDQVRWKVNQLSDITFPHEKRVLVELMNRALQLYTQPY